MEPVGSLKISKFSCDWTIGNFSLRPEASGEPIDSAAFSADGDDHVKWMLRLYPTGEVGSSDHLSLYLYLVVADQTVRIGQEVEFSIENSCGGRCFCHSFHHTFSLHDGQGYSKFMERTLLFQRANQLLPNDALTICCQVKDVNPNLKSVGQAKNSQLEVADDLGQLLLKPLLSDVTFKVGGQQFHAHKAILIARSATFANLFRPEFVEQRQLVDIVDIQVAVFEEIIKFIYTGRTDRVDEMADQLLAASVQYQLKQLKSMCQRVLASKLSVSNVAEMLVLADMHSADQLRDKAIEFINQHSSDVVKTTGWKSMVQTHPHLIASVYVNLLKG